MMALEAEVLGAVTAGTQRLEAASVRECGERASAKSFLQSRPAGVYTCARARGEGATLEPRRELVEWSFHLRRLRGGLALVDRNTGRDKLKLDKLAAATELLAARVLAQWEQSEIVDGMLSVLWYALPDAADYAVAVHICPMPTPKCLASTVLVFGEGRDNARCKHTKWIEDRVPIEEHVARLVEARGEPIHEVLLSKAGGGGDRLLLEGLITNFFVGSCCCRGAGR
ncbi:unnamed protein product [Phytophthora fragariaefolia]|uniref:Unnamed protein product n=1 Tax=Phytophthora fragariaefolia TaxID=1490495 RepID=A0A9W6U5T1_9STRA|nr:unnamed protein product [Phytophthora fragariaefolia]